MEKKIQDYLHLYLGCEVLAKNNKIVTLLGANADESGKYFVHLKDNDGLYFVLFMAEVKPILRSLSDMTEEEKVIGQDMVQVEGCSDIIVCNSAESFRYLLSKDFDLFGLIGAGLAIDKTKLTAHA